MEKQTTDYLMQCHAEAFRVLREIERLTIVKNQLIDQINKIEAAEKAQEEAAQKAAEVDGEKKAY